MKLPNTSVLTAAMAKQVRYLYRDLQAQPIPLGADITPRALAQRRLNWMDSDTASVVLVDGFLSVESRSRKQVGSGTFYGSDDHGCLQLWRERKRDRNCEGTAWLSHMHSK